ncbi:hypothetical protein ALC57_16669 [Trachymyrmex cornetzi]|uniref:Uncharacterized protein n=1 Tax=Trachymyrmex cornetzi TaxID=471704 RepID=A0A195DE03_9HYME|nr:hypothetical protein ALC57_16669 [Trachymyrmex cornetzi]
MSHYLNSFEKLYAQKNATCLASFYDNLSRISFKVVHVIIVLPEDSNSGNDRGRATRGPVVSFIRNLEIVSNLSQLSPLSVHKQRHSLHGPGPTNPAISRMVDVTF